MSNITNAIIAAMNVDQQAVQGLTKGVAGAQFRSPDQLGDELAYEAYKADTLAAGGRPLPIEQWRIVYSAGRQITPHTPQS